MCGFHIFHSTVLQTHAPNKHKQSMVLLHKFVVTYFSMRRLKFRCDDKIRKINVIRSACTDRIFILFTIMGSYTITLHVTIRLYRSYCKRTLEMRVESIRNASVRLWHWRNTYDAAIWCALIQNNSARAPQHCQHHFSIYTTFVASQQPNIVENDEWILCSCAQKNKNNGSNAAPPRHGTA